MVYGTLGGRCALIGGFVVRRSKGLRSLRGRYVYGDFCDGELRSLVARRAGAPKPPPGGAGPVPELVRPAAAAARSTRPRSNGPVYRLNDKVP